MTVPSIPLGLLFGFLIAKGGFNWLVEQGNLVSTELALWKSKNQQVPLFSLPVMLHLHFRIISYRCFGTA